MKLGRKLILAALFIYFAAGTAVLLAEFDDSPSASDSCEGRPGGPVGGPGMFGGYDSLVMLKNELGLSDSQYTQIKSISEKYAEKKYALRGSGDREAMHELHEKEMQEVEDILSSSQLETLKLLPAQFRARGMKEHLDLSDSQYTQVLAILEKYAKQAYELRGSGDFSAMRELRQQERDEIEDVLTDEQISKIRNRHKRGGPKPS